MKVDQFAPPMLGTSLSLDISLSPGNKEDDDGIANGLWVENFRTE